MLVDDPHNFSGRLKRLLRDDLPGLERIEDRRILPTYIKKLRKTPSEGTVYNNPMWAQTMMQNLEITFIEATEWDIEAVIDELAEENDWFSGTTRNRRGGASIIGPETCATSTTRRLSR
jgi:hypothetical protein